MTGKANVGNNSDRSTKEKTQSDHRRTAALSIKATLPRTAELYRSRVTGAQDSRCATQLENDQEHPVDFKFRLEVALLLQVRLEFRASSWKR